MLTTDVDRLAQAIVDATAEHDAPNRFRAGELEMYHNGPVAMAAGRIGHRSLPALNEALQGYGLVVFEYADGFFAVTWIGECLCREPPSVFRRPCPRHPQPEARDFA